MMAPPQAPAPLPQAPAPVPPPPPLAQAGGAFLDPKRNLKSLACLGTLVLIGGAVIFVVWYFVLPPSAREAAGNIYENVSHQPQTITDETSDIPAGSWMIYSFELSKEVSATLTIEVRSGAAVDVYLMDEEQKTRFEEAQKSLTGGEIQFMQPLSRKSTRGYTESKVLPAGRWYLIVKSNETVPLLGKGKDTTVHMKLVVQP